MVMCLLKYNTLLEHEEEEVIGAMMTDDDDDEAKFVLTERHTVKTKHC